MISFVYKKIDGTGKKLENLFKFVKVVFSILDSNREDSCSKESGRIHCTKSKSSTWWHIINYQVFFLFQLNRPHGQPCYKYDPYASFRPRKKCCCFQKCGWQKKKSSLGQLQNFFKCNGIFRWCTPSVRCLSSVHPSNHNFWCTCIKWWYL